MQWLMKKFNQVGILIELRCICHKMKTSTCFGCQSTLNYMKELWPIESKTRLRRLYELLLWTSVMPQENGLEVSAGTGSSHGDHR